MVPKMVISKVGEGELAAEEKEKIVNELVKSKPALFLFG